MSPALFADFLKSFLYLPDYTRLCEAVRALPRGSALSGQSLLKLHRSQRFALETEPVSAGEDALVPHAAFLLSGKHLTCPLPWLEDGVLLSVPECLEILSDLFLDSAPHLPSVKLASVNCFLRLASSAHLSAVVSLLRELLRCHAASLEAVCITVVALSPYSRAFPRHQSLHRATDEAASENARPKPSSAAALRQPDAAVCPTLPQALRLGGLSFKQLQSLQIGLPINVESSISLPVCTALHLSYLNEDIISLWSHDPTEDARFYEAQTKAITRVIAASANSLESLSITGAVRHRCQSDIFDKVYLPKLFSVNLGWTTPSELNSLSAALDPITKAPVSALINLAPSLHQAITRASQITQIPLNFEGPYTQLPPRLPVLRHAVFNGPLRSGLCDQHLSIYGRVLPRGPQEELHLQYGILKTTCEGLIQFRWSLRNYCHFAVFRHPASLLHKVIVRRSFEKTGGGCSALDFPSRYTPLKLEDLFLYEYVIADLSPTRQRKVSRYELILESWPEQSLPPPKVCEQMSGRDLFALEFWQLPMLLAGQFDSQEIRSVYDVWDKVIDADTRALYNDVLVHHYVRERVAFFPFKKHSPWWSRRFASPRLSFR